MTLLASVLFAVVCTPIPTCGAGQGSLLPPRFIQSVGIDAGTTQNASVTFLSNVRAGSWIGVAIRAGSHTNHSLAVTDLRGNSYVRASQMELTNDSVSLAIFYANNDTAGPNTVTVSDSTSPGTLRIIAQEWADMQGTMGMVLGLEGNTGDAAIAPAIPTSSFKFSALSTYDPAEVSVVPPVRVDNIGNKLFVQSNASSATMYPAQPWGVLSVEFTGAQVGECATPTPTLMHDSVGATSSDLAGYTLYYRQPGGTWQKLVDWPCDLMDECRAAFIAAPMQRYCPSCQPYNEYEFSVKAFDKTGNWSDNFSNAISICAPPLCTSTAAGLHTPCN